VVGLAAAAAGAVAQTAHTPLDPSNVTHSSALDDAQLQRTLLKPKFLTENSSTVVAQTGVASRISCLVANLGDCVVSQLSHFAKNTNSPMGAGLRGWLRRH
jgi:hypothetical protein